MSFLSINRAYTADMEYRRRPSGFWILWELMHFTSANLSCESKTCKLENWIWFEISNVSVRMWLVKKRWRASHNLLPSRELTYPTKRVKENHLQKCLLMGYVGSQEGISYSLDTLYIPNCEKHLPFSGSHGVHVCSLDFSQRQATSKSLSPVSSWSNMISSTILRLTLKPHDLPIWCNLHSQMG